MTCFVFSLLHAFLILPKVIKRSYQLLVYTLCPKRCPLETKNHQNGSVGIQDRELQQQPENSDTSRVNIQVLDGHISIRQYKNHTSIEDGMSNELINDLICDNITLKNKLDKILAETESLNRKYYEIDTRINAMNDVCDIVLVDIVKDGNTNKTNQTKDGKQPKKPLLCP